MNPAPVLVEVFGRVIVRCHQSSVDDILLRAKEPSGRTFLNEVARIHRSRAGFVRIKGKARHTLRIKPELRHSIEFSFPQRTADNR